MGLKDCPPRDALDRWASGDLLDDEADAIAEHLDTCTDCEQTIADSGDAGLLACAGPATVGVRFDQEKQCEAFVSGLRNLAPQSRSANAVWLGHDHWAGRQIRDYQLLARLGQGAMGTVYAARHTRLNKQVAIKLLTEKLDDNPAAVARFQREMQAVGLFEHPNVVQALDAGEVNGVSFLVMELVDGIDLAELTSGGRVLDIADACEIARQVAVGLQYAHSRGLVHRDIKPSNLMLARDANRSPCVKILDLGLATIEGLDAHVHLTDDGQLMGTLEFMAPEQAEDTRAVDHRADLYSLGATLFRLLTGSVPFAGPEFNTPASRLNALMHSTTPSIAIRRSNLPQELVRLVDGMLARQPNERPRNMSEVEARLQDFATGHELERLLEQYLVEQQRLVDTKLDLPVISPSNDETVDLPTRDREVVATSLTSGSRWWRVNWLMLCGLPIGALLLATIWLKTDGGYIQIEVSDPSISTSVEVLKNDHPVETIRVDPSLNRLWYRSGRYEIRLATQPDDEFEIVGSRFSLTRDEVQVVTISRVASADHTLGQRDSPDEPRVIMVTTSEDGRDVPGSLRDAIAKATKGQTIRFDAQLNGKTIELFGEPLQPSTDLSIDASYLSAGITIDAGNFDRVFQIYNTCNVRMENLTITRGRTYLEGGGVAIRKKGARVSLVNCRITNCESVGNWGGGISSNGELVLRRCLLTSNKALGHGGAIGLTSGRALLENCLIVDNTTPSDKGGAISLVYGVRAELIHCTITNNSSGINCTPPALVTLESTIIANNTGRRGDFCITGSAEGLTTRGVNIIQRLNKGKVIGAVPLSVDPLLAPLGEYGGRFLSMPPLPESPAIDAAIATDTMPAIDIHGVKRPLDGDGDGNALPDIGAVEFEPGRDGQVPADSHTLDKNVVVPVPTRDLPDLSKLTKGKVQVFGTANQPMAIGAATAFDDFVEIQINSNLGWFGLRSNGDVIRWNVRDGIDLYREGQDVRVLNRTADAAYGEWLSGAGRIIQRGHLDNVLMANAPEANIVDLARSYPTGDWTVLTSDGRLHYIGTTEFPPPAEITDFVRLGNWHDHHLGIRENGSVVVWGRDPNKLPDLGGHRFRKIRSTEFYTLLLTEQGSLVHLTKEQIVALPKEFDRNGWVDIACGNLIYAARQTDGYWRAWGDPLAAEVIARINSLGANVSSISMTKDAAVWIETK